MSVIEVRFPVLGTMLPADHAYPLFAALSRRIERLHQGNLPVQIGPIAGLRGDKGLIRLFDRSRLRLRLTAEAIPVVLPLSGKQLEVAGHRIRLGVPEVSALLPARELRARVVTFRLPTVEPETFLKVAREKLAANGITAEPIIPRIIGGPRDGELRRQVIRVKGWHAIGYALRISELDPSGSVKLQEEGLGGRRHLGGGFLVPVKD
jgi:CRISPR-associated protein Cas6